jgi:hypothetical protein
LFFSISQDESAARAFQIANVQRPIRPDRQFRMTTTDRDVR